ncbi:hypothetical protein [Dehalococcoides mccartyi]|uniref:Uncharacterized protein n=1 Tax=Dehalococcoides mccartyi TaxID=61435 RepID=A0AB33HPW4_9CHLR|nr:hypothetical protein [Dehalococcoides mccartyi]BAS31178.1 hypothetical protein IBK_0103 [Dehalococcoides mccartyi IBARAKI]BAZ96707.1 hypothetical protein DEHALATV1_0079 [Dehalococcoides mccartyi]
MTTTELNELCDASDLFLELQRELFKCADELGKEGCSICTCQRACTRLWEKIQPSRNNRLSITELRIYREQFKALRFRRQRYLLLPAK